MLKAGVDGQVCSSAKAWLVGGFAVCWLVCAIAGLSVLWAYENAPGTPARPSPHWPSTTSLQLANGRPTLVFLAHPQCVCTRASLAELREALARATNRPKTYVVFLKPSSFAEGWEKSGLWDMAVSLPDTTVVRDDDGREAQIFGAATSGQTFLFDAEGVMLFNGGITAARGHEGDNASRSAIVALLNQHKSDRTDTKVFGCSLFASAKS